MDRTACVDVPALPLQILLRRRPEWRGRAVAVVAEDRPQSPVLWAGRVARRRGVRPGQPARVAAEMLLDGAAGEGGT